MTRHPFLEVSPFAVDDGQEIGRDPRMIREAEWAEHMPDPLIGLRAIRAKCLDCSHTPIEVRKCVAYACPLWPLRMGVQPRNLAKVRKHGVGYQDEAASDAEGYREPETQSAGHPGDDL